MRDVNPDALRHCEPSEAIQGSGPPPNVAPAGLLRSARNDGGGSAPACPPMTAGPSSPSTPRSAAAPSALGAADRRRGGHRRAGDPPVALARHGAAPLPPERIRLADLAADFIVAADDPRRAVAACTGAPACASGSTPTLLDAARLAETFRPLAARGLSAHVSGCAKGCAKPGPADLTLVGHEGAYAIIVGGAPGDSHQLEVPIEAALERLGRAATLGLAAAFASATNDGGRNRRPA